MKQSLVFFCAILFFNAVTAQLNIGVLKNAHFKEHKDCFVVGYIEYKAPKKGIVLMEYSTSCSSNPTAECFYALVEINKKELELAAINCPDASNGYTSKDKKTMITITEEKNSKYTIKITRGNSTVILKNCTMISHSG